MYMSRIRLNTNRRKTQLALGSPAKIHGAVERSFEIRQERTLWRIDRLGDRTFLLIVSQDKPDLCSIAEQFGYEGDTGEYKVYDTHLQRVKEKSIWRFRLVANPTFRKKGQEDRGNVTAHISPASQMQWLEKTASAHGFSLKPETTQIMSSTWKHFYRKGRKEKVEFVEAAFEGVLQVEDEPLFLDALVKGIGREKAYGMGMMTVIGI